MLEINLHPINKHRKSARNLFLPLTVAEIGRTIGFSIEVDEGARMAVEWKATTCDTNSCEGGMGECWCNQKLNFPNDALLLSDYAHPPLPDRISHQNMCLVNSVRIHGHFMQTHRYRSA